MARVARTAPALVTWHARSMRLPIALLVCGVSGSWGSWGCWRDGATPVLEPAPTSAPAISMAPVRTACRELGDHVAALAQTAPDEALAAHADQLARIIERRCATDGWSSELKDCLTSAEAIDVAERCEQFATEEQRHALDEDIERLGGED
jgi:histone H3/H4